MRAGDFASSRRPRVAEHAQFIWAKDAAGIPASAIARMIGCATVDVRHFLSPSLAKVAETTAAPDVVTTGASCVALAPAMPSAAKAVVSKHAEMARISVVELLSKQDRKRLRDARDACWADLYATGRYSFPQIAGWFGRDHTSIIDGVARAGLLDAAP